jgi:hypothetical protein
MKELKRKKLKQEVRRKERRKEAKEVRNVDGTRTHVRWTSEGALRKPLPPE